MSLALVLRAADVSEADLAREAEEDRARTLRFREEDRSALLHPAIDFRPSEEQEIRLLNTH